MEKVNLLYDKQLIKILGISLNAYLLVLLYLEICLASILFIFIYACGYRAILFQYIWTYIHMYVVCSKETCLRFPCDSEVSTPESHESPY